MARVLVPYAGYTGHSRADKSGSALGPRQEELLSYLTGLAPVGQPFEFPLKTVFTDLEMNGRWTYHVALRRLMELGFVRRISSGYGGFTGVLVVLRRLEALR